MRSLRENIIIPYNFGDKSEKAIKYAIRIASFLKAKIHLVYVIENLDFIADMFRSSDDLVSITDDAKNRLQQKAEAIKSEHQVEVFTHVEKGKPYQIILQKAHDLNGRFIIIGNKSNKDNPTRNLSSNLFKIVSESTIPVITVQGETDKMPERIVVPLDLTKQTRLQVYNAIAFALNYNAQVFLVSGLIGGIQMNKSRIYNKLAKVRRTIRENGISCEAKLFPRT
ncbi:MAG: universal stress protein, partial [Bacteroidetes bacterium]|nr:universal stress protein [Bacteroidota bacterium]